MGNNAKRNVLDKDIWNLIIKIRIGHRTYGKVKIFVILRRDYGIEINESSVRRNLKKLGMTRSLSNPRYRKTQEVYIACQTL